MNHQRDPREMTPAEIINELGSSAEEWSITAQASGNRVLLSVRGLVLPIKAGRRIRKGTVPFVGILRGDPLDALVAGLIALRHTEGSDR